jgi:HPt (histidine-containing phosphotransfer) domain-containing protein
MNLLVPEALHSLPAAILPRLVDMFATTTPALLDEIRQYAAQGKLTDMAKSAHKLKGSCVSLGAERMAHLCKDLQHKGETNDATNVALEADELAELYPQTLAAMRQAL